VRNAHDGLRLLHFRALRHLLSGTGRFKVPHDTSNENEKSSALENMTAKERFAELAGILAAAALRTRQSVRRTTGTVDEPGHARDLGPVHMPEK